VRRFVQEKYTLPLAGVLVGVVALLLGLCGNPGNMGFCVACFLRDTAGALGLHSAEAVQYIRPEIIGIVLGALIIALAKKDFAAKGGSSPATRFIMGICVMVGAMIFLGCPLRLVLRMAGGDLNAVIGLVGFVGGILTGVFCLNRGFTLRRGYDQPKAEGLAMPAVSTFLLVALLAAPAFVQFSQAGPGSLRAPVWMSLAGGLMVGVVAQRSRLCLIGGVRDAFLFKDFRMLVPFAAILATVMLGNALNSGLNWSFWGNPIAHEEWIWNILGLYLVGLGSVLLGGCPLRQLVLAGSGNSDAGITVLGLLLGGALVHNLGLASSAEGTTLNGRIALGVCLLVVFGIAALNTRKENQP
jgi:hypothetical protein